MLCIKDTLKKEKGWGDCSAAKNTYCFCRGPEFGSQLPLSVAPKPLWSLSASAAIFWPLQAFIVTHRHIFF